MDMKIYLGEVQHAVASLIPVIWSEHAALETAIARLKPLVAATDDGYRRSAFIVDNDLDDEGIGTGLYWDTYFGADKERYHAAKDVKAIEAARDARAFSRAALSSAVLQIARQGLSQVHGRLTSVPTGRKVLDVDLKDVIWQGRNQAIHWEEGKPHQPVIDCFSVMAANDPAFTNFATANLAFQVVAALGWADWTAFQADIVSFS